MSSININNLFFKGVYKDAWKKTIPQGLTEAEVDFILEIGSLNKDARVLDLMCGYGRHTLELGKRGVKVTAVDNLDVYISEINLTAKESDLEIKTIQDDAVTVNLDGELYEATICMGNSFNFFAKKDALTVLKKISQHLKPRGVLIINSWMIAEIAIKYFQEKSWHYAGDYKCILDYEFLFHPSRIESEQTVIAPDASVEVIKGVDYIFTLDELESMLCEAGLKTTELYSTPRKRRFRFGDTQIYIVAEKI